MEYTLEHDQDADICVVRVTGETRRPKDSIALQQLAQAYQAEHGCRLFLFDMRAATIITSTWETFRTATSEQAMGMEKHLYRIALVYSGDLTEHRFLENVAVNRGHILRVFSDTDAARDWLLSDKPSNWALSAPDRTRA